MYLIYKHTAPNGKAYIGQTKNYQRRCIDHRNGNKCIAFSRAIQKYGWDNFTHEILKDGLTLEEANFWEKFYIDYYKTIKPNGYNLRTGGDNSKQHASSILKISNSKKGKKISEYQKEKLRLANTGRKHTEEHKIYMREKMKNRKFSDETIEKMRQAAVKRNSNPEYRKRISNTLKGRPMLESTKAKLIQANTGRKMSEANKEALRLGNIERRKREKERNL